MPHAYDGGVHEREARANALASWEIEKQMERERSLGAQVK